MNHYERSKLADAIKEEKFAPDSYVIREVREILNYKLYFRVNQETHSISLSREMQSLPKLLIHLNHLSRLKSIHLVITLVS